MSRESAIGSAATATLLALALLGIYLANGDFYPIEDAVPSILLTDSLLQDGDLAFRADEIPETVIWTLVASESDYTNVRLQSFDDKIRQLVLQHELYASEKYCDGGRCVPSAIEGLYVNTFMPGSGLTAVPFLAAVHATQGPLAENRWWLWYGGKIVAAFCVAVSVVLIFLTVVSFVPRGPALLIAGAYGLGTCVWTVSSQALWQHGPNEMFLALGVFALTRANRDWAWAGLCGFALSAATWCRPTGVIVVVAVGIYLLLTDRRGLLAYILAGLPLALAMFAYNAYYLGSLFAFGQTELQHVAYGKTGNPEIWSTPMWYGLVAMMISPSRGLFIFSPFLIFAIWGGWRAWRDPEFAVLRPLSPAILAIWCLEAQHFDWWGGWSYGYRHIVDTVTLLAPLLAPVITDILAVGRRRNVFLLAVGWSILVQVIGAIGFNMWGWNARHGYEITNPDGSQQIVFSEKAADRFASKPGTSVNELILNVDFPQYRSRLWSLRDNQILYYLTHLPAARARKREAAAEAIGSPQSRTADSYGAIGEAYMRLSDFESAVSWLKDALLLEPQQPRAHYRYGVAIAMTGRIPEAEAYFREILGEKPDDFRLRNRLGFVMLLDERLVEAIAQFDRAQRLATIGAVGDGEYLFQLWEKFQEGVAAPTPADQQVTESIETARHVLAQLRDARTAIGRGQATEAVELLTEAVQRLPESAIVHLELGQAYFELGEFDSAAQSARRAISRDPENAQAYDQLGVASYFLGKRLEAREHFETAVKLDPEHPWARRHLRAIERKLRADGEQPAPSETDQSATGQSG